MNDFCDCINILITLALPDAPTSAGGGRPLGGDLSSPLLRRTAPHLPAPLRTAPHRTAPPPLRIFFYRRVAPGPPPTGSFASSRSRRVRCRRCPPAPGFCCCGPVPGRWRRRHPPKPFPGTSRASKVRSAIRAAARARVPRSGPASPPLLLKPLVTSDDIQRARN